MATTEEPQESSMDAFIRKVNEDYKGNVIQKAGDGQNLKCLKFSSGILSLDCALGGGWPFSRICLAAGEYSTGKTLLALKAAESVKQYDHSTHFHRSRITDQSKFEPGQCLFVDVEHGFDEAWAIANGWDKDLHYVAKPEYAEQAIDIVTAAIRENVFDLIVIDSIAALTPSQEISESTEDWQVGLGARLVNKAMRRWNASLSRLAQQTDAGGPLILCLNQFRLKIGLMFGDPRTLPMGKGQEFASAIMVYMKSAQVKDDEKKEHGIGEYSGVVWKNKLFIPKCNFKFRMALKDHDDWTKGGIDNQKQLLALAKKYGLIQQRGSKWAFGSHLFDTQKQMSEKMQQDTTFCRLVWRSVVNAFGGVL